MMDVGLTDIKDAGIISGKNFRESRGHTRMVLTGYVYQYKFKLGQSYDIISKFLLILPFEKPI